MNKEYLRVFKAFSNKNRVRILELLCEGEECACVLLDDLKIKQPTLSHHMKILCDSGIVTERREEKWSYYSINRSGCQYASKLIENIMNGHMEELIKFMTRFYGLFSAVKKLLSGAGRDCVEMSACECQCSNGK